MNILSIQSEVVTGHVGNAAARFALQRLGHEAWCVPTVLLSSHAGHQGFAGEATSLDLLQKLVDALETQGRLAECDGLVSGYLGSPEQAEIVAATVRRAKAANPKLVYCLDPAFGDDGRIYARPGVAEAMAEKLLPLADVVTPNAFELSVLSGIEISDGAAATRAVKKLARPFVVAKSVPAPGAIGALTIINDPSKRTLPLAIALFQGQNATQWGLVFAASVVAVLPVIVVFLIFQKYFVQGLTSGAVKG